MYRIVVLISGSGSNLQAIIDDVHKDAGFPAEIVGVISNKADAFGLERAKNANISQVTLSHQDFDSRETYDAALLESVQQFQPDLVVLAGFMRILTPTFVTPLMGKLINIHPSLLPKYPGLHTHARALENGDKYHGVSIHFVNNELDAGPLIAQKSFEVPTGSTIELLQNRVHELEHALYPSVVRWFAMKRVVLQNDQAFLDNQPIEIA